ncbi:MAG: 4-phytase [Candidatus Eremiobacteraeota bacterium]|nr:4-phytase [Candidatus Eremiobacteraeota bacterium]
MRSGPKGRLIPDIVTRIPTSANGDIASDNRTITYHLRGDVFWQDGIRLTARDVAYTFRQIMNPRNDTGARIPYVDVASARALDDRTLVVTLKRVDAAFVSKFFAGSFCWGILPAHVLQAYASLNDVPFNAMPTVSGPFVVASWNRGDRLVLEPNPRYFGGEPHIRIIDRFMPTPGTTVTALRTGEVDADFHADPAEAHALAADARYRIHRTALPAAGTLVFNVSDPVLHDPSLRRALGIAIDTALGARRISPGLFLAGDPESAAFAWAYDARVKRPHFDRVRAGRELDALGWVAGNDGVRSRSGQSLSLSLTVASDGVDPSVAVMLQDQLRHAGVDVAIKSYTPSTLYGLDGPLRTGRFQLAYLPQFFIDFDGDLSSLLNCDRFPPRGFNFGRYCNARVDEANRDALGLLNPQRRRAFYRVVQEQLLSDPPWLTLWRMNKVDIVPARLRGFVATPRYDPYYAVQTWRLPVTEKARF